jgi:hypothetical protein
MSPPAAFLAGLCARARLFFEVDASGIPRLR